MKFWSHGQMVRGDHRHQILVQASNGNGGDYRHQIGHMVTGMVRGDHRHEIFWSHGNGKGDHRHEILMTW